MKNFNKSQELSLETMHLLEKAGVKTMTQFKLLVLVYFAKHPVTENFIVECGMDEEKAKTTIRSLLKFKLLTYSNKDGFRYYAVSNIAMRAMRAINITK